MVAARYSNECHLEVALTHTQEYKKVLSNTYRLFYGKGVILKTQLTGHIGQ